MQDERAENELRRRPGGRRRELACWRESFGGAEPGGARAFAARERGVRVRRLRRLPGGDPCQRILVWAYHLPGELKPLATVPLCASRRGTSTRSSSGCRACCRGWTSGSRTSSACRRRSSPTTSSPSSSTPSSRSAATPIAAHGEAAWNGVAILSRVGLDDVVAGLPGGPGFPHQEARAVAATCAGVRVVSVYVPNGRDAGVGSLRLQARLAGVAARRGRGRAGGDGRLRRHEHRADRRGRVRSRRLRRPDACHAARAGGAGGAAGGRAARRRARPLARRAGVHLLGLPRRDVPPGLRDADRPRARQRRRSPTASAPPGSIDRPARARGRAITRR